jgi:hypothetical protein
MDAPTLTSFASTLLDHIDFLNLILRKFDFPRSEMTRHEGDSFFRSAACAAAERNRSRTLADRERI